MEDGTNNPNSWLTRTRYSHTVCHRLNANQFPTISLRDLDSIPKMPNLNPNSKFGSISMPINRDEESKHKVKLYRHSSSLPPVYSNSNSNSNWSNKPKVRSLSPLPARAISEKMRFSTPPPRRRGETEGKTVISAPPVKYRSNRKESSGWVKYFDHGGSRVRDADVAAHDWSVDMSKLYLGRKFASGAHSRLYHGFYKDQPVAVKLIRPPDNDENGEMRKRLEKQYDREVNFLSHLYHRNVIKLVAACKNPPIFCVITEYLSGGSLSSYLHKLGHESVPLQTLISIALDISRGMEYIHSQGIMHRDLKPENIILSGDLSVKIADFGISCEELYCDVLSEDQTIGTYRWMAPEMVRQKQYGRKVDVYSFGLLLWEMVSGRIPYEDMSPIQAAFAVVDKNLRPVVPTNCPMTLKTLIEQCWALEPEKRPEFYQIVRVLEQLESALTETGSLDSVKNLTCQDHKNRLLHWMQKLKPSISTALG